MMKRCNCPHYNVPSADPNDSVGCPVHDPNYVDPQDEISRLAKENETLRSIAQKELLIAKCYVEEEIAHRLRDTEAAVEAYRGLYVEAMFQLESVDRSRHDLVKRDAPERFKALHTAALVKLEVATWKSDEGSGLYGGRDK